MLIQSARICSSGQVDSGRDLTVRSLFSAEGEQARRKSEGQGAGVGLLLHRTVDDPMQTMKSAIDKMLVDMAIEGYIQPADQSQVARTLTDIRRTGKLLSVPWDKQARLKITCVVPNVSEPSPRDRYRR